VEKAKNSNQALDLWVECIRRAENRNHFLLMYRAKRSNVVTRGTKRLIEAASSGERKRLNKKATALADRCRWLSTKIDCVSPWRSIAWGYARIPTKLFWNEQGVVFISISFLFRGWSWKYHPNRRGCLISPVNLGRLDLRKLRYVDSISSADLDFFNIPSKTLKV